MALSQTPRDTRSKSGISPDATIRRSFLHCARAIAFSVWFTVAAAMVSLPLQADDVDRRDWTGDRPPRGWSEDAYSPNDGNSPSFDFEYDGPEGSAYDPREDPNHPLKNPTKDPGKEWEGSHGSGNNQTFLGGGAADWPWGERYYDAVFAAPLIVHNKCKTPQKVGIFVYGNEYLTMPAAVMAQPGDTTVVGTVQLAPEPPGPHHSGDGWIDFGPIIIPAGMFPPPQLHQPNYDEIEGEVVVWHAWSPEGSCNAARKTYTISGHMHFNPPPPDGDSGPQQLAEQDMCKFWWLMGEPPAQIGDKDCSEEMRGFAAHYLDKIIASYVLNSPDDWLWLPSAGAIAQMSIAELLAMKAHAEAVIGIGPGADAAASGQPPADAPRGSSAGAIGGPVKGAATTPREMLQTQRPSTQSPEGGWSFDNGARGPAPGLNKGTGAPGATSPGEIRISPDGKSGGGGDSGNAAPIRRIEGGKGAPVRSPIDGGAKSQQIERVPGAGQK